MKNSEITGLKLLRKWEEMTLEREEARAKGMREGRREGKRGRIITVI